MSFNKAVLIGRLTKHPEVKKTNSGNKSVCSFDIAVDRDYTDRDGNRKTDFIPIVAWEKAADFVGKYFSKGQWIGVEGSIEPRSYTDKDGNKRYITEIRASRCFFVGNKERNTSSTENASESEFDAIDGESEDLPF